MNGIACAGNWIVDHIKIIDCWPKEGELTNIRVSEHAVGGSSPNVLTDLQSMQFPAPTWGIGCIGDDDYGRLITEHCAAHRIDMSLIRVLDGEPTSYTDVMTVADGGHRTFFHHRGANALFSRQHVDLPLLRSLSPRIFHLGYLLLLDGMDASDEECGTVAAAVLRSVQDLGIETSIDVVTEASDRFSRVVGPALKYVDHCIVNEYEAAQITGVALRGPDDSLLSDALPAAAAELMKMGVRRTAVIHCPEGGFYHDRTEAEVWVPGLRLPDDLIVGAVGAGDAFCAGVLYGIHEGWDPTRCLEIANGTAAMCLGAKNTTDGVGALDEVEEYVRRYTRRD